LQFDQPEIAGIGRNLDARQTVEQLVKDARGPKLQPRLAFAGEPPAVDYVVAFLPTLDHLADDFGRILQIGIHHDNRIAGRRVHSGADCNLMAEISR